MTDNFCCWFPNPKLQFVVFPTVSRWIFECASMLVNVYIMWCCAETSHEINTFLHYQKLQTLLQNFTKIVRFMGCWVLQDLLALFHWHVSFLPWLHYYCMPFIPLVPEWKINSDQQHISVVQTPHPIHSKETTLIFMFSFLGEVLFTNKVFWK